jgi:hypothetical protein
MFDKLNPKYQHRAQTSFPNNMNTIGDMLMINES